MKKFLSTIYMTVFERSTGYSTVLCCVCAQVALCYVSDLFYVPCVFFTYRIVVSDL